MRDCGHTSSRTTVGSVENSRIPRAMCVCGVLIMTLVASMPQSSVADENTALSAPTVSSVLLTGVVTSNYGTSIQINGRNYSSHPSLVVTDDEGRPRAIKDAAQGMQVKYHVKNDQIDQLVIVLMR